MAEMLCYVGVVDDFQLRYLERKRNRFKEHSRVKAESNFEIKERSSFVPRMGLWV